MSVAGGEKIKIDEANRKLVIPDNPVIPFIEGDGTGPDIWHASRIVFDAAVEKAYEGKRKIHWLEVLAGEKAFEKTGDWLPEQTTDTIREYVVSIKGPLTTPVGGGIRSLNVALRQILDLYACVRPVRWIKGTPNPVLNPGKLDVVIFRENTEDVYAGIEWESGTKEAEEIREFLISGSQLVRASDWDSVDLGSNLGWISMSLFFYSWMLDLHYICIMYIKLHIMPNLYHWMDIII